MTEISVPESLRRQYEVCCKTIPVGPGSGFSVWTVRDPDALIDTLDPEKFEEDERLPYWAEIWPSSIGLGLTLFEHRVAPGTTVLELGCGIGVAGIAAAIAGLTVLATDYEPDALAFAAFNAQINSVSDRMSFSLLDWRKPEIDRRFGLIIGSDILYERSNHAPVAKLIEQTLEPGGTALLSDPNRRAANEFVERMKTMSYRYSAQPRIVRFEGNTQTITVHRFCGRE
ncbi:MAG: methyltransferase domain-containing protein [candidate division Zixibacteria bacterium]|nr:methyltransferase domain-containing protein [candidate division Zixibacteria bacterium]